MILILGIALFTAGLLSFFLVDSKQSDSVKKIDSEIKSRENYNKPTKFIKRLKDYFASHFGFIAKGFRYINDLITKVILPRLSIEQRSKFYATIRFFSQLKRFILSYYYLILCAIAALIIYNQAKKMIKTS